MNTFIKSAQLQNIRWLPAPFGGCLALLFEGPGGVSQSLLTGREAAEGRPVTSPPARRRWLLGRLAAKAAMARLTGAGPEQVAVLRGPGGRPQAWRLDGRLFEDAWVSISHTVGAAAAVAARIPVGLDLERRDRRLTERVRQWVFSPAELALIQAGPEPLAPPLALWCAKEAGAKSWGLGLLNHLAEVRVTGADWPAGRLTVCRLGGEERAEARLMIADDFLLAVSGRNPDQEPRFDGDGESLGEQTVPDKI